MSFASRARVLLASALAAGAAAGCAGRVEPTSVQSGSCDTAGQSASCVDRGTSGTQTCLPTLMMWSTCAPAGKTSSTPQPECAIGDTQACDFAPGFQAARSCVQSGAGFPVWTDCCGGGVTVACQTADARQGEALCQDGQLASTCGVVDACEPGQTQSGGSFDGVSCETTCQVSNGVWEWDSSGCDTPLVLAFDDEPVVFTHAPGEFDLAGRNASFGSDWVSAETPWLALDRDGNGRIDDGGELFGSMTEMPDGHRAENGFAALAELDDDGDGTITPRDAGFDRLLLWRDLDQDRRSAPSELVSVRDAGVISIRLGFRSVPRCTEGDCEVERGRFVFRDSKGGERQGSVVDVHLERR